MNKNKQIKGSTKTVDHGRDAEVDMNIHISKNKGAASLLTDLRYERVLHNVMEFGRAGKSVKLLRLAFDRELRYIADPRLTPRLQKLMMEIIKSDPCNVRGMRSASAGNLRILSGFEFSPKAPLTPVIAEGSGCTIDRAAGRLSFTVPQYTPAQHFLRSEGYTSYRLIIAVAEINFDLGTAKTFCADSECRAMDSNVVPAGTFTINITPGSANPLLPVIGIQYFRAGEESEYMFGEKIHNTLTMLKIDIP